ncbi:exonuclease domain-containing protein [Corynebacterium atypicum]|uniref:exonuclease domain-containing protein n=1 Tax=Corynebacterium atypicum TaxID=191610 RepID=UPI000A0141E3|nr:exonuclease domain-containing protein [Corynebacterium atypicum]
MIPTPASEAAAAKAATLESETPTGQRPAPAAPADPGQPADPGAAAPTAPYVVVTLQTNGIHPSSGRVVSVDAITFSADFTPVDKFHQVINPGDGVDPGPVHLHGLSHEDVAGGRNFGHVLSQLDRMLDGRTLFVHDAPFTWGFIVAEAKRAMNAAARANRSRRGRGGKNGRARRRRKVGHVPQPERIVDTLACAYRSGAAITDTRPGAVARTLGMPAPRAGATTTRAKRAERDTSREATMTVARTAAHLERTSGWPAAYAPEDLSADKLGLQRSHVRVDAAAAPRPLDNPGVFDPAEGLKPGQEFVVADEVSLDPDELIARGVKLRLAYVEKLSRQTSIVVGNLTADLRGKAMHAARKDIPIVRDDEFVRLLDQLEGQADPGR